MREDQDSIQLIQASLVLLSMPVGKGTKYPIARFFRGHLFSRISAGRENIFREFLGATPSSRSAPTWVWSGFGLILKIFFAKFASVSNSRKYRSAKKPSYNGVSRAVHFKNIVNCGQTLVIFWGMRDQDSIQALLVELSILVGKGTKYFTREQFISGRG